MVRFIARALSVSFVLAACGPTYQSVKLVNATNRTITEIYIYPAGAPERGASRATLAPSATAEVKVVTGNIDVLAISEKVRIDETSHETRTASKTVELKVPLQLIFHDSTQTPPALREPSTRGVTFRVEAPAPAPTAPPAGEREVAPPAL